MTYRKSGIPLSVPPAYCMLLALAQGESHGSEIQNQIIADTVGFGYPAASTLYRELARLERQGLIRYTTTLSRERRYALTHKGHIRLASETQLLMRIVQIARTRCGI